MMLIEALQKVKIHKDRLKGKAADIEKYASMVSTAVPQFDTVEAQRDKVKELLQGNKDLVTYDNEIRRRIILTNLLTRVFFAGTERSLQEILDGHRHGIPAMRRGYEALNENSGTRNLHRAPSVEGKPTQVVRLYSEQERLDGLKWCDDFEDEYRTRIEVINATTPLQELPQ